MNNEITVKPSQFKALLRTLAEVDLVPFVMSSPGLGKSMMAYQLAQEWGLRWIDIRLAYRSPVDILGYPMAKRTEDGRDVMVFAQPGELPVEEGNFIIFDEFSCASKATANASLQMVLDRKVGDYHLPKETFLMLAGNRKRDKCHVEQLASALVNRVCMITLEADSKDWLEWAAENGVHPLVQAFIRIRPELLSAFDGGEWDHESGFPSPRSWAAVSKCMLSGSYPVLDDTTRAALLSGYLGAGASTEFRGFEKLSHKLPDVRAALSDPVNTPIPSEPSEMAAMCAAFIPELTVGNFGNAIAYMDRLRKEYTIFGLRMATNAKPELLTSDAWMVWSQDNAKLWSL